MWNQISLFGKELGMIIYKGQLTALLTQVRCSTSALPIAMCHVVLPAVLCLNCGPIMNHTVRELRGLEVMPGGGGGGGPLLSGASVAPGVLRNLLL